MAIMFASLALALELDKKVASSFLKSKKYKFKADIVPEAKKFEIIRELKYPTVVPSTQLSPEEKNELTRKIQHEEYEEERVIFENYAASDAPKEAKREVSEYRLEMYYNRKASDEVFEDHKEHYQELSYSGTRSRTPKFVKSEEDQQEDFEEWGNEEWY